ncbi:MAG: hypothetical protein ACRCZO_00245, partial [Cetobacterium sp.]
MGKSQSKLAKLGVTGGTVEYDTPVYFQMRKMYGRACLRDMDKLVKHHDFPPEGTLSVTRLTMIKANIEAGDEGKVGCCKRKHVCVNCSQTVNCWLQEAEKRERRTLQKQLVQPTILEVPEESEGKEIDVKCDKDKKEKEKDLRSEVGELLKEHLTMFHPSNPFYSVFPSVPPPSYSHPPHLPSSLQCVTWVPEDDCSPPRRVPALRQPQAAAAVHQPPTSQPLLEDSEDQDII